MLVAAETDALPGGKVGGVADVLRGLPLALADRGWQPTVLTPAYGMFNLLPGSELQEELVVNFAGDTCNAAVWRVQGPDPRISYLAIEHPLLSPNGPGQIYCNDGAGRPFATDASKFAFFCAATAALVRDGNLAPDVIHLHDWHAALYLVLRAWDPAFARLQNIRTVFTIHNMALQGIRPLANDESSLDAWFPGHNFPLELLVDPRYSDCVNPLAAAIRLADGINTVSPTYAEEILLPSNPEHGFIGGEGLDDDLRKARLEGRLTGILNGCDYALQGRRRPGWSRVLQAIGDQLASWDSGGGSEVQAAAAARHAKFPKRRPANVLVSVGRLTAQKAALFMQPANDGRTALETILDNLGNSGVFIMLGSGDRMLEERISAISAGRKNFLFVCGYSDTLAPLLYKAGDVFLMPSSFEPCGISQMFAMRVGQPCIVHGVGGLKDTVDDGVTGFVFGGDTPAAQAENFIAMVERALQMKSAHPKKWIDLCARAKAKRFSWEIAAETYENDLYESSGK